MQKKASDRSRDPHVKCNKDLNREPSVQGILCIRIMPQRNNRQWQCCGQIPYRRIEKDGYQATGIPTDIAR